MRTRNKSTLTCVCDARDLVAIALRSGALQKQPCAICGELKVNAHHCDYSKPLDVMWLCDKHHGEWHANNVAKSPFESEATRQKRLADQIKTRKERLLKVKVLAAFPINLRMQEAYLGRKLSRKEYLSLRFHSSHFVRSMS